MAAVSRNWEAAKALARTSFPCAAPRQGAAASLAHIPMASASMSRSTSTADPSIAPGTATISHGGCQLLEGKDILRGSPGVSSRRR